MWEIFSDAAPDECKTWPSKIHNFSSPALAEEVFPYEFSLDLLSGTWWLKLTRDGKDNFLFDLSVSAIPAVRKNRHEDKSYKVTISSSKKSSMTLSATCADIENAIEVLATELSICDIDDSPIEDLAWFIQQSALDALPSWSLSMRI